MWPLITLHHGMKLAEEVIREHAPQILLDLGMNNLDGILNRITISPEFTEKGAYGICNYTSIEQRRGFSFSPETIVYKPETAHIIIYTEAMMSIRLQSGNFINNPYTRISRKGLKRFILLTLAHELRHYWQVFTGEMWAPGHGNSLGFSLLPYDWSWEEIDAREYANKYVKEVSQK
jgi:hypothetical protein